MKNVAKGPCNCECGCKEEMIIPSMGEGRIIFSEHIHNSIGIAPRLDICDRCKQGEHLTPDSDSRFPAF
ncbi:MAG: hypothetical protein D4R72_01520 [Nitrosopumilales archaeon]|nr:MAG: hypothetical protein D4R72_01520 [Nitrosopumilales archaeon]